MNAIDPLHTLIGSSPTMMALRRRVGHLAGATEPVLIQGPTGTGKELVARALHQLAHDPSAPLVAVNCATLPPTLATAELFGTEPGGFTGATRRPGVIREAAGGTLLLDEIGELAPEVQGGLLRVLECGELIPVGGAPRRAAAFRLICATHRDLSALVAEGRFRADLLYRIDVLRIRTPALSERLSDLPELLDAFSADGARWGQAALSALARRPWPGNVRQLKHEIRAAELEADLEESVEIKPAHIRRSTPDKSAWPLAGLTLHQIKQRACAEAVEHHNGNVRAAALALGVSPNTLYRHLPQGG